MIKTKKMARTKATTPLMSQEEFVKRMKEGTYLRICSYDEMDLYIKWCKNQNGVNNDFNRPEYINQSTINAYKARLFANLKQKRYRFVSFNVYGFTYSSSPNAIYFSDIAHIFNDGEERKSSNVLDDINDLNNMIKNFANVAL